MKTGASKLVKKLFFFIVVIFIFWFLYYGSGERESNQKLFRGVSELLHERDKERHEETEIQRYSEPSEKIKDLSE
ncbi:MAG: putative membrane protein [Chlamydiales bacterium]|jgi:uncharacterized membrane protein